MQAEAPAGDANTAPNCLQVVQAIEQRLQLLDKVPRVRINAWLKKLKDEISSNATWQRNRNCYARLLLEQVLRPLLFNHLSRNESLVVCMQLCWPGGQTEAGLKHCCTSCTSLDPSSCCYHPLSDFPMTCTGLLALRFLPTYDIHMHHMHRTSCSMFHTCAAKSWLPGSPLQQHASRRSSPDSAFLPHLQVRVTDGSTTKDLVGWLLSSVRQVCVYIGTTSGSIAVFQLLWLCAALCQRCSFSTGSAAALTVPDKLRCHLTVCCVFLQVYITPEAAHQHV